MSPVPPMPPVRPQSNRDGHQLRTDDKASGHQGDGHLGPFEEHEEQGDVVEINENEGEAEEVQPAGTKPSPVLPTASEVEDHRVTHLPFRRWCRECIEGRALGVENIGTPAMGTNPESLL